MERPLLMKNWSHPTSYRPILENMGPFLLATFAWKIYPITSFKFTRPLKLFRKHFHGPLRTTSQFLEKTTERSWWIVYKRRHQFSQNQRERSWNMYKIVGENSIKPRRLKSTTEKWVQANWYWLTVSAADN